MVRPATDLLIPSSFAIKNQVCGVEIYLGDEGRRYSYMILCRKGKKIEIGKTGEINDHAQLPPEVLKSKIPLILIITGKVTVTKKVQFESGQSTEKIFTSNFPAAASGLFYGQLLRQELESGYLTLTRKDIADPIIKTFDQSGFTVADIFFGPIAVAGMKLFWDSFNQIPAGAYRVTLANNLIDNIFPAELSHDTIRVGELEVNATYTLSFATGINYFLRVPIVDNLSEDLERYRRIHIQNNKLKFLAVAFVAAAFLISAANMFYFTTIFNQDKNLETELNVFQGKYDQINKLLTEYQKNKALIEGAGVLNKSRLSESADMLAKTVPADVVVQEFSFNPPKKREAGSDSLETFNESQLVIRGMCVKSLVVNEWVNVLKMQQFVDNVILEKFAYNSQSGVPNFEMRVRTK